MKAHMCTEPALSELALYGGYIYLHYLCHGSYVFHCPHEKTYQDHCVMTLKFLTVRLYIIHTCAFKLILIALPSPSTKSLNAGPFRDDVRIH